MGSHKNSFCVYSCKDEAVYNSTGKRPTCTHHEHVSRTDANALTAFLLFTKTAVDGSGRQTRVYEFSFVTHSKLDENTRPLQAIVNYDPMEWSIRRSGGAFGCEVHQLVHAGKR